MNDNEIICEEIKLKTFLTILNLFPYCLFLMHFSVYGEKIPINKQKTDTFPGNFSGCFRCFCKPKLDCKTFT